ncbi:hypothetical protein BC943DRAFT_333174 [Umbelopsis sp. AD052]|nr:hypothetical protein BC943DRAFT_333174 [Umbelopsis sp. AD052]
MEHNSKRRDSFEEQHPEQSIVEDDTEVSHPLRAQQQNPSNRLGDVDVESYGGISPVMSHQKEPPRFNRAIDPQYKFREIYAKAEAKPQPKDLEHIPQKQYSWIERLNKTAVKEEDHADSEPEKAHGGLVNKFIDFLNAFGESPEGTPDQEVDRSLQEVDLGAQESDLSDQDVGASDEEAELGAREVDLSAQKAELDAQAIDLSAQDDGPSAQEAELDAQAIDLNAHDNDLSAQKAELDAQAIDLSAQDDGPSAQEAELGAREIDLSAQEVDLSTQDVGRSTQQHGVEFEPSEEAYDTTQAGLTFRRDDTTQEEPILLPTKSSRSISSYGTGEISEFSMSDNQYDNYQQVERLDDNARRNSWSKPSGKHLHNVAV